MTWHGKGDYFATVMHEGGKMAVLIHLLSKRHSQVMTLKDICED